MDNCPHVLRFYPSEKIFHAINAVTWIFLIGSGLTVKYKWVDPDMAAFLMLCHVIVAVLYTVNVVGFILLAPDRFLVMLQSLLTWDKNTLAWFRNFGGYPRKLFGIPFGPEEVAPQGRYNGGQKPVYLYFILAQWVLLVTGWAIFLLVPSMPRAATHWIYYTHLWCAISASALVLVVHIPLAIVNKDFLAAMWRIGPGTVPLEAAQDEMAQWVADDVVPTKITAAEMPANK